LPCWSWQLYLGCGQRRDPPDPGLPVLRLYHSDHGPVHAGDQRPDLWLASSIAVNWFNVGFYVDGFWPALLGSIIVSIVSFLLSMILFRGER
jgi:hypothetical protein